MEPLPVNLEKLTRECECFTRHLISRPPSPYVIEEYKRYHERAEACRTAGLPMIETYLLAFARIHPLATFLADTYASRVLKTSVLRRKLALLLALCECSPGSAEYLDSADGRNTGLLLRMILAATLVALALPVSVLMFAPVHAASTILDRLSRRTSKLAPISNSLTDVRTD